MSGASARRLDWGRQALDAYLDTLTRIGAEDSRAANLVEERVDRALASILEHPGIGTPSPKPGERSFAVPNTGHVLHYRVFARSIRVTLWYRARRDVRR